MGKFRFFMIITVCLLTLFSIYSNIKNNIAISALPYGIKANALRKKLKIPILDSDMPASYKATEFKTGNHWESAEGYPDDWKVAHAWKNITGGGGKFKLESEWDSYRRKVNDSIYQQFNISSKIIGDSIAIRQGDLFFVEKHNSSPTRPFDKRDSLNEYRIDSVAKKWHLEYLVKGK